MDDTRNDTGAPQPRAWSVPRPVPLPLDTRRLTLRPVSADDAAAFFPIIDAHRAELARWLPWPAVDHLTAEQCFSSLTDLASAFNADAKPGTNPGALTVFMTDKDSGEILGGTGLHGINPSLQEVEIGYWIRPDRQGEGLCTESTAAWISCLLRPQDKGGFGLRRLRIVCDVNNTASAAVPRKLGLRLEGRFRGDLKNVAGDGFRDSYLFAVLADEWDHDRQRAHNEIDWPGWPER